MLPNSLNSTLPRELNRRKSGNPVTEHYKNRDKTGDGA